MILPGQRGWIKVKNRDYWRYELELETIKGKVERRAARSYSRPRTRISRIIGPVAYVKVRFGNYEIGLSEKNARFIAEQLEKRRGSERIAQALATRIEREAEAPMFAAPTREVELDEAEKGELVAVLDALNLDVELTDQVRALHRGLREINPR